MSTPDLRETAPPLARSHLVKCEVPLANCEVHLTRTEIHLLKAELHLAVQKAEQRARMLTPPLSADDLHDHRTAVAGDLADALDRLVPRLGFRFMQAIYPEVDLSQALT